MERNRIKRSNINNSNEKNKQTNKKQKTTIDFSTNNVRIISTSFSSFGFWRQPGSHL